MQRTFISYSQKNMILADMLEAALNVRGIRTWRDKHNMKGNHGMQDLVRGLIKDPEVINSYILVATPESLESDAVMVWELAEALKRRKFDSSFGVFVLLDGVEFSDLAKCSTKMGLNLTNMLQVKVPDRCPTKDLPKHVNIAARTILEWKIDQMKQKNEFAEEKIVINLHTREETLFDQNAHFEINLYRSYFKDGNVYSQHDWDSIITSGLQDLKTLLAQQVGTRHLIEVQSKGQLSAVVALGYTFRETSGFHMTMTQVPDTEPWTTAGMPSSNRPLQNNTFSDDVNSKDVIVELAVSNRTDQLVEKYMKENGMKIRARDILFIQNPSGQSVGGTQDALDIANQVACRLKELHDDYGPDTVFHVFYSGPIALAMIIGHKLNACGKIRLYDLPSDKSAYYPTALLA